SYSYDPQVALPTLVCTEWNNATQQLENVPCSRAGSSTRGCLRGDSCPIKYVRLTKLTQPDGRSYTFQYGTWGNLIAVDDPDGASTTFDYGASFAPIPPGWNIPGGGSPSGSFKLLQQRLRQTTVYPNGRANPAVSYVTSVEHVDWNGHGPFVPDFP